MLHQSESMLKYVFEKKKMLWTYEDNTDEISCLQM